MAGFVQIIEFRTSRIDEVRQLVDEMRTEFGPGAAMRGTAAADRDVQGHYYNIVEFESYESAMENSARPEIGQFAARMAALCDEPPTFYNLDVIDTWEGQSGGPSMKTVVAGAATAAAGVAAAAAVKSRSGSESSEQQDLSGSDHAESTTVPASDTVTATGVDESAFAPAADDAVDYPDPRDRPPV